MSRQTDVQADSCPGRELSRQRVVQADRCPGRQLSRLSFIFLTMKRVETKQKKHDGSK